MLATWKWVFPLKCRIAVWLPLQWADSRAQAVVGEGMSLLQSVIKVCGAQDFSKQDFLMFTVQLGDKQEFQTLEVHDLLLSYRPDIVISLSMLWGSKEYNFLGTFSWAQAPRMTIWVHLSSTLALNGNDSKGTAGWATCLSSLQCRNSYRSWGKWRPELRCYNLPFLPCHVPLNPNHILYQSHLQMTKHLVSLKLEALLITSDPCTLTYFPGKTFSTISIGLPIISNYISISLLSSLGCIFNIPNP